MRSELVDQVAAQYLESVVGGEKIQRARPPIVGEERTNKQRSRYRDKAKATIASVQPNSAEYTEAIKVFLRCDGAIEALNWVMELGAGDFSVAPAFAQRERD